jgi:hypothetical protein
MLQKFLTAGFLAICWSGAAFAAGPPPGVLAARQAIQNTIPQDRAEIHGLREAVKAGRISPQEARLLIRQIRAQIKALRGH